MNYLVLSIVKAIFEVPAPFTLKGSGLRMIALVWLVEMVITNLTLTINFYRQLVLLHERTEQVEENSIKAQYAALQNQLNPHFLFNSLNTLISEIYRYILQSQQQRLVTIESELSFIDSYIFLHKVRLGDCIRIENRIEADNYDLKLPSLTLQLLVENVIKHNIINMDMPMNILIDYDSENGRILVTNKIRIKPNVVSTGMGLKNLSARYLLICNQDITIENNTNYFTVKIPVLNE